MEPESEKGEVFVDKGLKSKRRKPLRKAVIKGVKALSISDDSEGLRLECEEVPYIKLGCIIGKINVNSELRAFMQDLKLSEKLEITIKKVRCIK